MLPTNFEKREFFFIFGSKSLFSRQKALSLIIPAFAGTSFLLIIDYFARVISEIRG